MDVTSFVLGLLTMIGVIFVALIVVGLLKISALHKTTNNLRLDLNELHKLSDQKISEVYDRIEQVHTASLSYTDSRIDRALQSKKDPAQQS